MCHWHRHLLLGRLFPSAQVYSIDFELNRREKLVHKSENVHIIPKDIFGLPLKEGPFDAESQDFIFNRHLLKFIEDWPGYIKIAFQLLKRGGYMEIQETNERWHSGDGTDASVCRLVSNEWT